MIGIGIDRDWSWDFGRGNFGLEIWNMAFDAWIERYKGREKHVHLHLGFGIWDLDLISWACPRRT